MISIQFMGTKRVSSQVSFNILALCVRFDVQNLIRIASIYTAEYKGGSQYTWLIQGTASQNGRNLVSTQFGLYDHYFRHQLSTSTESFSLWLPYFSM